MEINFGKETIATLAYMLSVYANWQIAHKRRRGFLFSLVGNCTWVGMGIYLEFYSMVLWSFAFMIPNIRGFYYWGKTKDFENTSDKPQ